MVRLLHSSILCLDGVVELAVYQIETLAESFFESSHVNFGTEQKTFPVAILRTQD